MPEPTTPTLSRVTAGAPPSGIARRCASSASSMAQEAVRPASMRGLGAVEDVVAQALAVVELGVRAVHVAGALAVGQEQVVAAGPALDVHVLAELDVAAGAHQEEAPVAPDRRARRRSSSRRGRSRWRGRRRRWRGRSRSSRAGRDGRGWPRRRQDAGGGRPGEVEELLELVRGDVDEDLARPGRCPRTSRAGRAGRPGAARGRWCGRPGRSRPRRRGATAATVARLQVVLGVADRPDAPGLGLRPAEVGELRLGGAAGLVDHHVLAGAHGAQRHPGPVAGDAGADDHQDPGILEDRALVGDTPGLAGRPGRTRRRGRPRAHRRP